MSEPLTLNRGYVREPERYGLEGYGPSAPALARLFQAVAAKLKTRTVFPDISVYQDVVNSQYPYGFISCRADSGYSTDGHIEANYGYVKRSKQIQAMLAYVVAIPGNNGDILARIRNVFGATCPPDVAFMVDAESGQGFAGPHENSSSFNALAEGLARYTGDRRRVAGYANRWDWDNIWTHPPSWMKRVLADWSGTDKTGRTWWAQQYKGDFPNQFPGLPGSCPPFGTRVDLNFYPGTLPGLLADLGLAEVDPLEEIGIMAWFKSPADLLAQVGRAVLSSPVKLYGHKIGRTPAKDARVDLVLSAVHFYSGNAYLTSAAANANAAAALKYVREIAAHQGIKLTPHEEPEPPALLSHPDDAEEA